jgi:hypothetical protein
VPGDDIDLIHLDRTIQNDDWRLRHQPDAQVLGHGLHVAHAQAQLLRDLPVGEVGGIAESVRNCPLSGKPEEQRSWVAEWPELVGA